MNKVGLDLIFVEGSIINLLFDLSERRYLIMI